MDPVKVDPQLFVTCRLCMETMGLYQITPAVQEQFKYCFDIDVSPFDGLPQLICEECQTVLNDYSTKKRIYSGRQNALHVRWQIRKEMGLSINDQPQQQNTVSSSLSSINGVNKTALETRRASKVSHPDTDRSRSNTPLARKRKVSIDKDEMRITKPLRKLYMKKIICRICGKLFSHKGNLRSHLRTHELLLNQYSHILKQTCMVDLGERADKLLPDNNLSSSTVMLEPSRIIGQEKFDSKMYSTLYIPKHLDSVKFKTDDHTSGSDSDEALIKYGSKYNKRPRILSTDTLVLSDGDESSAIKKNITKEEVEVHAENKDKVNKEIECIDIDDSSNASSVYDNDIDGNDSKDIDSDTKIIQKIVNICYQKFEEKSESESEPVNADPGILKHKLLSIGRKLINKEGVNSVGLLRYMECKNLEIKLISSLHTLQNTNVYVMPKLKDVNEKDPSDSMYWKKETRKVVVKNSDAPDTIRNLRRSNTCKPINKYKHKVQSVDVIDKAHLEVNSCRITTNDVNLNVLQNAELSKILNANPVANPKQLPKKTNIGEKYNLHMWQNSTGESSIKQGECETLPKITSTTSLAPHYCDENISNNLHNMPIIKSTISLAEPSKIIATNNTNAITSENHSHPRIKVKDVSELMSDPALISYNQQQAFQSNTNMNQTHNVNAASNFFVTFPPAQNHNSGLNSAMELPNVPGGPNNDKSRVILDTVTFPNTLTDSPFRYFKNLLHIHGIILYDYSDKPLPPEFINLIKFKIQFSREAEKEPILLSLSINCYKNMFYLGVADMNRTNVGRPIDVNKLSATWQWHILQIYATSQDIINKVNANAQNYGTDVVQSTATFLSLLRSIKLKQP